jgi:dihydrofolate synthase/folylpolyglutamate synthase
MSTSALTTLDQWLAYQETLHKPAIDLGLQRVSEVANRLGLLRKNCPVITIAGTNGKGSCVALLESILIEAGYSIGSYTSPHLLRYNERVRINLKEVTDEALCEVFAQIDQARGETSLSYFEFGTLAALSLFGRVRLDAIILEVGLGGRLDAVNILDPDLAIITSIGLDHTEWLGKDRESIGFEKAGIMRPRVPAVCGDADTPRSIISHAARLGAPLYTFGTDFSYRRHGAGWDWYAPSGRWEDLNLPALKGEIQLQNASSVLLGLMLLRDRFPVDLGAINRGLAKVSLAGRYQCIQGEVEILLDIAHNSASAQALAATLKNHPLSGRTHAVLAVLSDKDASGIVGRLRTCVDFWYLSEVDSARALPAAKLAEWVELQAPNTVRRSFSSIEPAYRAACQQALAGDRILVCGSVLTVSAVLSLINQQEA